MNSIVYLIRPWVYLRIRGTHKATFDWVVPLLLTVLTVGLGYQFREALNIYGSGGVLDDLTSFIQSLPGFFIAALAAVATFNRVDLDALMPEPTPTVPIHVRGISSEVKLSRRRFLSILFAFLTAQSIAITVIGIALKQLAPSVSLIVPCSLQTLLSLFGLFVYSLMFWQLLTVTCIGLYYLGDRMHQPET